MRIQGSPPAIAEEIMSEKLLTKQY
jgi:putative transposase